MLSGMPTLSAQDGGGARPRRGIATLADVRARCTVDAATHCWIWQGACNSKGKPYIWSLDYARMDKRVMAAQVAVWQIAHGEPVPQGRLVFRGCGNARCVNPVHLRVARSQAEMWQHIVRAGHLRGRGVEAHRAALVKARRAAGIVPIREQVVRAILAEPVHRSNIEVAAQYGVSHSTVARLRRGETRADVPGVRCRAPAREDADAPAR